MELVVFILIFLFVGGKMMVDSRWSMVDRQWSMVDSRWFGCLPSGLASSSVVPIISISIVMAGY